MIMRYVFCLMSILPSGLFVDDPLSSFETHNVYMSHKNGRFESDNSFMPMLT